MERFFDQFESFLKRLVSRRTFIKTTFSAFLYFISESLFPKNASGKEAASTGRPKSGIKGVYDLVVCEGQDSYKNTVEAIRAMGGMEKFVKKGSVVVVKPNMAWDRTPEQAANTDPDVVAALVEMCYNAGAKRVNVFDRPCNDERRCHEHSGIRERAKAKSAHVYFIDEWNVLKARFSYKSPMEGWPILRDAIECDTFINAPVLKHHGLTGLTLSMKNLMGVCAGRRGFIHDDIGRKLVDLTDFISPDLTVIDATRVLVRHGPSGGNLEDVVALNKIIAATDPTLADAYAARLVDKNPLSIPYIKNAVDRNFGSAEIEKAKLHVMKV